MDDARGELARAGEAAAAAWLEEAGLAIQERNFRCAIGEVDLVASEGPALVFVEVKTRKGTAFGRPSEAVSPAKQARLRRLAAWYLAEKRPPHRDVRFDVVEVIGRPGAFRITHLRSAF